MSIPTEVIMKMATIGLSEEQAKAVADMLTAVEVATAAAGEEGKEKARARWRKWSQSLDVSRSEWIAISCAVLARDDHVCAYCGSVATEADHVLPLSQGGASAMSNLVAACRPCNGGKSGRTPEQWRGASA